MGKWVREISRFFLRRDASSPRRLRAATHAFFHKYLHLGTYPFCFPDFLDTNEDNDKGESGLTLLILVTVDQTASTEKEKRLIYRIFSRYCLF